MEDAVCESVLECFAIDWLSIGLNESSVKKRSVTDAIVWFDGTESIDCIISNNKGKVVKRSQSQDVNSRQLIVVHNSLLFGVKVSFGCFGTVNHTVLHA